jgi:hypothetical protein
MEIVGLESKFCDKGSKSLQGMQESAQIHKPSMINSRFMTNRLNSNAKYRKKHSTLLQKRKKLIDPFFYLPMRP